MLYESNYKEIEKRLASRTWWQLVKDYLSGYRPTMLERFTDSISKYIVVANMHICPFDLPPGLTGHLIGELETELVRWSIEEEWTRSGRGGSGDWLGKEIHRVKILSGA